MSKIAMTIHGGAGPDSEWIKSNIPEYKKGLKEAVEAGYNVLAKGGSSLDAVEASVNHLENNPLFNAGRGSVLNEAAEVEMEASIMSGKDMACGAVALLKGVKNPVTLARAIMEKTKHVYVGSEGALLLAQQLGIELKPPSYFITEYNYDQYEKEKTKEKKEHGTVGAVALDRYGNVAAATSTGGLENKNQGRIGDSSVIGVGSYANNNTCAVSCTGDGEYLIQQTSAFHLAALIEYKGLSLQEACNFLIHEKCKNIKGDMGLIAVNTDGIIGIAYNSERMHRAWLTEGKEAEIFIYNGS